MVTVPRRDGRIGRSRECVLRPSRRPSLGTRDRMEAAEGRLRQVYAERAGWSAALTNVRGVCCFKGFWINYAYAHDPTRLKTVLNFACGRKSRVAGQPKRCRSSVS